jgi:HD-GYP domain-containing protein (c-di-GMP phosphodiesterase class II)/HAMP domain-containing protein
MIRRYPLHIHISTLFLLLLLVVGGLVAGVGYKLSRDMLENSAEDLIQRISSETLRELEAVIAPAEMAVNMLSHSSINTAGKLAPRLDRMDVLREALASSSALSSIYVGYDDGDFFFVRRIRDAAERASLKAPEGAQYVVQSIDRGDAEDTQGIYLFLGKDLETLQRDERPDYAAGYDPRSRGWYKDATTAMGQIKTAPYLFFSNRKVGMTLAARSRIGHSVVGADILLETLSAAMARQKVTPGSQLALVDGSGNVIAHENVASLVTVSAAADAQPTLTHISKMNVPVLPLLAGQLKQMKPDGSFRTRMKLEDGNWLVTISPVALGGALPLHLINAIPENELLAAAIKLRSTSLLVILLIIAIAIPATWFTARVIARPLRALTRDADAIRNFEFSQPVEARSFVEEFDRLAVTMYRMKRTIRRFLDLTATVAAEEDFDRLLPMLLTETLAAADGDAGVLYLVNDTRLMPAAACNSDGVDLMQGLPRIYTNAAGPLLMSAIKDGAAHTAELQDADIDSLGLGDAFVTNGARYGVAVPLLNRRHQLVGMLLLLRATSIEDAQLSFIKALSGSSASTLETRELIKSQKELFEAFIQLIAGAIDAKSPYTGGHCARVPELTKMLARAACAETTGLYRDFQLTEDQWEEVHIAAWLHDCGKVTTPEYVVDKATKLETIYDRIHEVRTRFEVLKRDAEIACLKSIAAGEPQASARERLAAELKQIDDDFAFVATCNEGGEFMAPEKITRLKEIAQRTWTRTLDDRIGISHEEKTRKERAPAPVLPAVEPLLADKPEHVFERRAEDRIPEDNKWGFRLTVPERLYDRGELHNLSVARGTLSDEERYKINEHMVQTVKMLTELPFPKHLRNVAELAIAHHEKMDGTGYPRRLKKDDMSPVARMMAIADIFEALTAADRPYKKGKTLSEAIKIMSFMKKDQHIDPELFDLFLRTGVYREYAGRFMNPEQIDEVNIAQYLSQPAAA